MAPGLSSAAHSVTGYLYSPKDLVLHLFGFSPFTGGTAWFEPGDVCRAPQLSGVKSLFRLGWQGAAWESSDQADVMEGDSTCRESFCCLLC